ncbi:hydrophobic surface binding protein A-domain-containing protein [Rhexocercosporidium sp. MPI-PUGE-AT-0058]|nr:hydrophobic surface binding protein A-domain-containing protein [Rhexocercosporidium sp. MPI-PUGE-AT-0058]
MVAIKNILFFITAASALTVGKRDAATILSDISTIDSNVKALTATFNNYNGGVFSAFPILGAESKLEDSIKQGTTDAKASSQQSSADSKSIIAAIDNLIPDIEASLAAAEKKRAQFAADNLTATVQKDLANLKAETDDFADALIAIASADTKAQGTAQKAKIDSDFDAAIAYFA